MKRILIVLLALAMVLSMAFALASCNDDKKENDTKETEKPAEKEPAAIPEGYVLYDNGKITFAYPEKWTKTAGSVDIITNESGIGNNITVSYEQYSDTYKKMTVEDFNTMLKPYLEAAGMTVANVAVTQLKNGNEINVTKIVYTATANGVSMGQTLFVVAVGELNYIVTVTETEADAALVNNVFNTLNVK